MRLRRGETVPRCLRTDSRVCCRCLRVIICAVLAALATLSTPDTLRKVGRFAAGAQIITLRSSALPAANGIRFRSSLQIRKEREIGARVSPIGQWRARAIDPRKAVCNEQ